MPSKVKQYRDVAHLLHAALDWRNPVNLIPDSLRERKDKMFELANDQVLDLRVVEIGSQWGWWAVRAAAALPYAQIYCIDPWLSGEGWGDGEKNILSWARNLGADLVGKRVWPLGERAHDIVDFFKDQSVDLLFLDGSHETFDVLQDLDDWYPKMKPGGVMVGHDWDGKWGAKVQEAVKRFFGTDYEVMTDAYATASRRKVSPCWIHKR